MIRRALPVSILLYLFSNAASFAQGTGAGSLEEGIIKVALRGSPANNSLVQVAGDSLFLPFSSFCTSLRILNRMSETRDTLEGEIPTGNPFRIIRSLSIVEYDTMTIQFDAALVRVVDDEVYVYAPLLSQTLGIKTNYDSRKLRLEIIPDKRIPLVSLRSDRTRYARLAANARERSSNDNESISINRAILGSLIFDWTLRGEYQKESDIGELRRPGQGSVNGDLNLSTPLLFGLLRVAGRGSYLPMEIVRLHGEVSSWDWQFLLPESSILTRASLRSTRLGSSDNHWQYEVGLNNIPLAARSHFSVHELTGETYPDWMVEMYDGRTLIEVTGADSLGRYRFEIPVGYGTVQRTLNFVGPHGERIIEERTLQYNSQLLPPGELEYALQAIGQGVDPGTPVEGRARVRFGVSNWLSLGVDAQLPPSLVGRDMIDSIMPGINADLWLGGVTSMSLRYNPRSQAISGLFHWVPAQYTTLQVGVDSFSVADKSFGLQCMASVPIGPLFLSTSMTATRTLQGLSMMVLPRLSASLLGFTLSSGTHYQWIGYGRDLRHLTSGGRQLATEFRLISNHIPGIQIMGGGLFDHMAETFPQLNVGATLHISRFLGVSLGYEVKDSDWKRGTASMNISMNVGGIQSILTGSYEDQQLSYGANSLLQGSALISSAGVDLSSRRIGEQSVIVVTAFHDLNSNGVRDGDEEDLVDPTVTISSGSIQSTGTGGAMVFVSNKECDVLVDGGDYMAMGLYPKKLRYSLYSLPGTVHTIDVPFSAGFDVSGQCEVRSSGSEERVLKSSSINGLTVRLVSIDGSSEATGEIFSDGSILISGVTAGEYVVMFDEHELLYRRLKPRQMVAVGLNRENTRLPMVVLEPVGE